MTPIIRDALPGDAVAIAEAHVAAWAAAYRGMIADEILDGQAFRDARVDGWTRALNGPPRARDDRERRLIVPEVDGQVAGFSVFGRERHPDDRAGTDGRGELYGFYVHPDAWGTGVADALMEESLRSLRGRFTASILWVLRDNPRARRFYERSGWTCGVGEHVVTDTWGGPVMPGSPELDPPLAEVQYRIGP